MEKVTVRFRKLNNEAIMPRYAHVGDSGMDVFANNISINGEKILISGMPNKSYDIPANTTILIGTGLSSQLPLGYEIQIRPTSGNSLKTPLRIANSPGTNDSNYRGEIGVIITNTSGKPYSISSGAKIAQLVLQEVSVADIVECDEFPEDNYTNSRGSAGYGSTGTANNTVDGAIVDGNSSDEDYLGYNTLGL